MRSSRASGSTVAPARTGEPADTHRMQPDNPHRRSTAGRTTIMQRPRSRTWRSTVIAFIGALLAAQPRMASASDHLDTPTVIADPAADIADLFAWTSTDGRRLNLVMTVIG